MDFIDYKRADILSQFVQERGKILPRRMTGVCSRHQRWLGVAIKRARNIALMPFAGSARRHPRPAPSSTSRRPRRPRASSCTTRRPAPASGTRSPSASTTTGQRSAENVAGVSHRVVADLQIGQFWSVGSRSSRF